MRPGISLEVNLLKRAAEVFKICPACESKNLLVLEGEVLCLRCDWTSIEAMEEARMEMSCRKRKSNLREREKSENSSKKSMEASDAPLLGAFAS